MLKRKMKEGRKVAPLTARRAVSGVTLHTFGAFCCLDTASAAEGESVLLFAGMDVTRNGTVYRVFESIKNEAPKTARRAINLPLSLARAFVLSVKFAA